MGILQAPARGSRTASLAPRRNRFTQTMGAGLAQRGSQGTETWLTIVPIEAPCYAVRIGLGNCYNQTMPLSKASVYPSDSYSVLTASSNAGLTDTVKSTQYAVVPTGGAPGSPLFWDNAGADVATLNEAGTTRAFTLPAVTANTSNLNQAFTIQWSDWTPCTSIARADGGVQPLLFVYVTLTGTFASNNGIFEVMNGLTTHRNRYHWQGQAWATGTDFADNPTGTGFKSSAFSPLFAIQYLTMVDGVQVVINGDSLSAAPTTDNFSTPLHRASWDLSTPTAPIAVANLAWGGTSSTVYAPLLASNIAAMQPSVVAYQPISRNGPEASSAAGFQMLFAKNMLAASVYGQAYGSRILLNQSGLEPSFDGNSTATTGFVDMRNRALAAAASSDVPFIDAASVIGNVAGAAPWDYLATYSDDNTHPNDVGAEAITPLARTALRQLIG